MSDKDETAAFEVTNSDMPPAIEEEPSPPAEGEKTEDKEVESPGETATAEDDDKIQKKDESGKKNRVQKRIDEVVRERENVKRENESLKKQLSEVEIGKKEESGKEPLQDDFETYDEYLSALDKFDNSKQVDDKKPDATKDTSETAELTDAQRTAMAVIREKVSAESDKYTDFDDVSLNPEVQITGDMLEALAECDDPAKIMYHLGKNLDVAAGIAGKSPAQQMREIAKLDFTVDIKPPKPKSTTKAADPVSPVRGSDAQKKPLNDMSYAEHEAEMNEQEKRSGGSGW